MIDAILDQTVGRMSGPTSLTASATTLTLWGLSASEFAVIVSAVVAVASFAVHFWYTARKDRRAQEMHERAMRGDFDDDASRNESDSPRA